MLPRTPSHRPNALKSIPLPDEPWTYRQMLTYTGTPSCSLMEDKRQCSENKAADY